MFYQTVQKLRKFQRTQCDQRTLFFQKAHDKKILQIEIFYTKMVKGTQNRQISFLFHFSKHSICTKVVLSSPNLTYIDQDTKIDPFSIVFFVFHKALVPFRQI